jgi:SAM-dependent methyltransferase
MRQDEFRKMHALQGTHWWFQGRRRLLFDLVNRLRLRDALVLDAGCGTGFAREELERAGTVIGLDSSPEAVSLAHGDSGSGACVAFIERTPFPDDTFDLISAMDLLEHIEDDERALREIHRVCKPGGYLFVTVPAYQRLWSSHDEALGHRRRYSAREIARRLRSAGFRIRKLSHTVTSVLPLAAAYRCVRRGSVRSESDLSPALRPVNFGLTILARAESWIAWRTGLPLGLTLFVLASKESADPEASK